MRHLSQIILCSLFILVGQSIYGQEVYQGMIYIRQNLAQLSKNTLYLEMDINIHGLKVNSSESLSLQFTLFNDSTSTSFLPIILNGEAKQRKVDRAIALKGPYMPRQIAYAVLENDPMVHQVVTYKKSLDFQPWMKHAALKLSGQVKDKNENVIQTFVDILTIKLNIFEE